MNTWILIIVLHYNQPLAPTVIQGFRTESDCQATAQHLHDSAARVAPTVITTCVPARLVAK